MIAGFKFQVPSFKFRSRAPRRKVERTAALTIMFVRFSELETWNLKLETTY
jgi:hypothetical protein